MRCCESYRGGGALDRAVHVCDVCSALLCCTLPSSPLLSPPLPSSTLLYPPLPSSAHPSPALLTPRPLLAHNLTAPCSGWQKASRPGSRPTTRGRCGTAPQATCELTYDLGELVHHNHRHEELSTILCRQPHFNMRYRKGYLAVFNVDGAHVSCKMTV